MTTATSTKAPLGETLVHAGAISRDLELPARVAPGPRALRVRGLALVAEDEALLEEVGVRV